MTRKDKERKIPPFRHAWQKKAWQVANAVRNETAHERNKTFKYSFVMASLSGILMAKNPQLGAASLVLSGVLTGAKLHLDNMSIKKELNRVTFEELGGQYRKARQTLKPLRKTAREIKPFSLLREVNPQESLTGTASLAFFLAVSKFAGATVFCLNQIAKECYTSIELEEKARETIEGIRLYSHAAPENDRT